MGYAEVLKIPPADAKLHLMMPHFNTLDSRRVFTVTGFLLAAALMAPINQLRGSPWLVTVFFSLANACFGLAPSGFKANYLDITEQYVGVISGYGNTLGTVASWIGPQLVALVLAQVGSWDAVLLIVAGTNLLAALNYFLHAT